MDYNFQRISNYGTTSPVVARILVQTSELFKFSNVSVESQEAICKILEERLYKRIINCYKIRIKILKKILLTQKEIENKTNQNPYIIDLDTNLYTFLYECKNFLRDLVGVFNEFYFTDFDEPSSFYNANSKGSIWVEQNFGAGDKITGLLKEAEPWIKEIIFKRNTVEHHPKGYEGILVIENFKRQSNGNLLKPIWYRDQNKYLTNKGPITEVIQDINHACCNMLILAEELIAFSIEKNVQKSSIL
ncbi:MAG: hypothetical protein ACD_20C00428G0001 [uncultured bacterium]|nr:MAG: hypothetical protein ACD_20C00428G0001 [uncultured bacterium]